jgi:hypothetical protein
MIVDLKTGSEKVIHEFLKNTIANYPIIKKKD